MRDDQAWLDALLDGDRRWADVDTLDERIDVGAAAPEPADVPAHGDESPVAFGESWLATADVVADVDEQIVVTADDLGSVEITDAEFDVPPAPSAGIVDPFDEFMERATEEAAAPEAPPPALDAEAHDDPAPRRDEMVAPDEMAVSDETVAPDAPVTPVGGDAPAPPEVGAVPSGSSTYDAFDHVDPAADEYPPDPRDERDELDEFGPDDDTGGDLA